ncbi:antibiotic biosynthesis monooxygenase [Pseudomonas syringae group genomosp. 3]|uniref:ABM domain-containing protein n=1 Tax=Pseudomonas syringae pv. viburni TaxID=251703 RepID=A0A0Q0EUN4_9PSED|nr:antibiotic biosynthesis monooxygenase [Pseudomonas syringae group genomosp. 3]KPZ14095.1 Uncharacterized protein ALO40_01073 [Pseudomonas syringae pv. viburni]
MHINAVSTLEIRTMEETDERFEWRLRGYSARFAQAEGCIGFSVVKGENEPCLWILTGCWVTPSDMKNHFDSTSMKELIDFLVEKCTNLKFASFSADT